MKDDSLRKIFSYFKKIQEPEFGEVIVKFRNNNVQSIRRVPFQERPQVYVIASKN